MPTSGIYRTSLNAFSRQRPSAGFTLLELTVVLVMIGIIAALALPNLSNLYESIDRNTERDYILDQLAKLGQHAWATETDLVVYDSGDAGTAPAATTDLTPDLYRPKRLQEEKAAILRSHADYQEHSLDLPAGWVVLFSEPMLVRASGVCLGAEITLRHESGFSHQASLKPPYCHARS